MRLSPVDAAALAVELGLDYETTPVCPLCLTFVSFPLDVGDDREARRQACSLAPDLWADGLEQPVRHALRRARERGVERAAEAIRDVEQLGPRSEVVRAIVLRLAHGQVEDMRSRWLRGGH